MTLQVNSKGRIELEEMEFYAYHGCFKEEQVVGNKFLVNVSFSVECKIPSETDRLEDAINYVTIYEITREQIMIKSHLLEHVTKRIINKIRETFPIIENLVVKVSKMNPPVGGQMRSVSVTMTD